VSSYVPVIFLPLGNRGMSGIFELWRGQRPLAVSIAHMGNIGLGAMPRRGDSRKARPAVTGG
jgi:hypothetical protein